MKLSSFIDFTLTEIVDGMLAAREGLRQKGVEVSPCKMIDENKASLRVFDDENEEPRFATPLNIIEFEVVLTESQSSEKKAGIGVYLGGIGVGVNGNRQGNGSSQTKIKFSIPITYP